MRGLITIVLATCAYRIGCGGGASDDTYRCEPDGGAVFDVPDAGFDSGAPDAGVIDAGIVLDAGIVVLSSTAISDSSTFTYVELDLDWTRGLAYLGSRRAGVCVDVVDVLDPRSPRPLGRIGSAAISGCLGVALFADGTKLALSANNTSNVQIWDLTSNPRADAGSWASLGNVGLPDLGKRFAAVTPRGPDQWDLYLASRSTLEHLTFALDAGFALAGSQEPGGMEFNDVALVGGYVVAQSYLGNAEPLLQLAPQGLGPLASVPTSFWAWSASSNDAGTKAFFGGAPGFATVIIDAGAIEKTEFSNATSGSTVYRDAVFVTEAGGEHLYALYAECQVDVFDLNDARAPVLLRSGSLPSTAFVGECYALRVNPTLDVAWLVTNRGTLVAFKPSTVPPATFQYPRQ